MRSQKQYTRTSGLFFDQRIHEQSYAAAIKEIVRLVEDESPVKVYTKEEIAEFSKRYSK